MELGQGLGMGMGPRQALDEPGPHALGMGAEPCHTWNLESLNVGDSRIRTRNPDPETVRLKPALSHSSPSSPGGAESAKPRLLASRFHSASLASRSEHS